jgi:hypothetical protein
MILFSTSQYYSSFLYLLRVEPVYLAKAVMEIPFTEMDYMVQCLSFSLFPDLFQAREELYLLDLIKVFLFKTQAFIIIVIIF